jgi:uncharacterized protein (TIGR03437 family)
MLRGIGSACRVISLAAIIAFVARADLSGSANRPSYSAASIVNAATQTATALAPNTIATIYGTNLAFQTYTVATADLNGGALPLTLQGVTVLVGGLSAPIFYLDPNQINFLIPYELAPGPTTISVARDGVHGPNVTVQLNNASPGFFEWNGNLAVAEHADGRVISPDSPAAPGEIVVLFAAGLGWTSPNTQTGIPATGAAQIVLRSALQVLLNGAALPPESILYAGLTPQCSGLYQINLKLPSTLPENPVIQIALAGAVSPDTVLLPAH